MQHFTNMRCHRERTRGLGGKSRPTRGWVRTMAPPTNGRVILKEFWLLVILRIDKPGGGIGAPPGTSDAIPYLLLYL
jgi:hypothetical protein